MHMVVWFTSGDPENRVSAFISSVDKIEHFKDGTVRIKSFDEDVMILKHVKRFEMINGKGEVSYKSSPRDPVVPQVKTTVPQLGGQPLR